jgi:arylsulfatase A-like enzyme
VSFIDRQAGSRFFLEVAYNAVHWPFQPPDLPSSHPQRSGPPRPHETGDLRLLQGPDDAVPATRQDYVRMLERADEGVGAILASLDRHGLSKETLVVFTNDNGGEWLSRNTPLHHRKSKLWEGGIRVPMILRWPGRLPAGKTSGQVAITMDLTASIVAAAEAALPAGHRLDGINILPTLAGESPIVERQLFWRIARPERQQKAVRSGRWKLLRDGNHHLLFDLAQDPGERRDLAAERPELVVRLKALLADWEKDVDRKPPSSQ